MDDFTVRDGTVLSVQPDAILVRIDKEEDCGGCRSCAVRALCQGRDGGHLDIPLSPVPGVTAVPGERVRVEYRGANPAVAALIMFVPALIGLFAGGLIGNRYGEGSDGILLLGCLVGLVLGLVVSIVLSKARSLRPEARLLGGETGMG